MQLVLDGSDSIEGSSASSYAVPRRQPKVQKFVQGLRHIFVTTLGSPTVRQCSSRVWDGTRPDGHQSNFRPLYVANLPRGSHQHSDYSQDDLSNDPELAGMYIVLTRVDGHASWVSKPVLELMVTGRKIPEDVDGGEIIRDKDGVPTGITLSQDPPSSSLMDLLGTFVDNAMSLVPIPDLTPAQVADYFNTAMHDALEVGLTNIHDASGADRYIGFFKE